MLGNITNQTVAPTFAGSHGRKKKNIGFAQTMATLSESMGLQKVQYTDVSTILNNRALKSGYMSALLEDYVTDIEKVADASLANPLSENHIDALELLIENSAEQLLSEAFSSNLTPLVGLTFPLLKINWLKNIYKDIIPTVTSDSPVFNLTIEKKWARYQDAEGQWHKKYLPDAYIEDPNFSLEDFSRVRILEGVELALGTQHQLVVAPGNPNEDRISTDMHITDIKFMDGEVISNLYIQPNSATGTFTHPRIVDGIKLGYIQGQMDFETGTFSFGYVPTADAVAKTGEVVVFDPAAITVKVYARLSAENHFRTPETGWEPQHKQFRISDGMHLATGITKETQFDQAKLYNTDAMAMIVETMQDAIGQEKDSAIKRKLSASAERIRNDKDAFITSTFDCKVPSQLNSVLPSEWIEKELKVGINKLSLRLNEFLREEDIVCVIMGRPEEVNLLSTDTTMIQGDAKEIGGCKRGYKFGLYNNMRNFLVVSSEKADAGRLQLFIFPTCDDKMTYKLFNYQFFITNEYRQSSNMRLPSVAVSDRYLIDEFTPIQGELVINNNSISSNSLLNNA